MKTKQFPPLPIDGPVLLVVALLLVLVSSSGHGQAIGDRQNTALTGAREKYPRNFDEVAVPSYKLPDPLVANDGTVIDTTELWKTKRRPEILEILETNLWGRLPGTIDGFESKPSVWKKMETS